MSKPFDINKPFKTRNGEDVEILSLNGRNNWMIGYIGGELVPEGWNKITGEIETTVVPVPNWDLINDCEKEIEE